MRCTWRVPISNLLIGIRGLMWDANIGHAFMVSGRVLNPKELNSVLQNMTKKEQSMNHKSNIENRSIGFQPLCNETDNGKSAVATLSTRKLSFGLMMIQTIAIVALAGLVGGCGGNLSKEFKKAEEKISKIKDQSALEKIATTDTGDNWIERLVACQNLTNQLILAEIARNDTSADVRGVACQNLTNQLILAEIARNDKSADVRGVIVEKLLTDQAVLAEIARNEENSFIRKEAVRKLTGQAVLAEIARNEKMLVIREEAVKKLTDQVVLAKIARGDNKTKYVNEIERLEAANIRMAATERLTDQAVLWQLAGSLAGSKDIDDIAVRVTAYAKLESIQMSLIKDSTDQTLFAQLAINGIGWEVRLAAIEKLSDQAVLTNVAENSNNRDVRRAAVNRLEELKKQ